MSGRIDIKISRAMTGEGYRDSGGRKSASGVLNIRESKVTLYVRLKLYILSVSRLVHFGRRSYSDLSCCVLLFLLCPARHCHRFPSLNVW